MTVSPRCPTGCRTIDQILSGMLRPRIFAEHGGQLRGPAAGSSHCTPETRGCRSACRDCALIGSSEPLLSHARARATTRPRNAAHGFTSSE